MSKRIGEGLIGALLGAAIVGVIAFYVEDGVGWPLAFLVLAICFVLGALVGGRSLFWLLETLSNL